MAKLLTTDVQKLLRLEGWTFQYLQLICVRERVLIEYAVL